MKQDVKTNDNTAPRVVLAFVFPITPPRDPVPPNKMGASTVVAKPTNRRKESRVGRVARWKRGGIMRGDARATRSHARPIPGRDQTSVGERRFASGRAGGGWLVTRMGSWRDGHHVRGEMVTMVMWLGTEQRTALHASARGRTESPPPLPKNATRIDPTARERHASF